MGLFLIVMGLVPLIGLCVWVGLKAVVWFAIRNQMREVPLFFGLVQLLLWEPQEGLVILRNKRLYDDGVIQDSQGGMIFISALRGQELRARVPLNLRQMEWSDTNVLTRDSIRVTIRLAILWRVSDLPRFVFDLNSSISVDRKQRELGPTQAAESWLRVQTEGSLRSIVSRTATGLLISSKATRYLHEAHPYGDDDPMQMNTSESIAATLGADLNQKCHVHGIEVRQVEIQEVSLPADLQAAIDKVWEARLLPARTEQEARARQIELEKQAEVLGIEAVRANTILQNFQGSSFIGGRMPLQFIQELLAYSKGPATSGAAGRPEPGSPARLPMNPGPLRFGADGASGPSGPE
jgi:regulator of protease activity HflC (stomatin/prohibitin superfamily)